MKRFLTLMLMLCLLVTAYPTALAGSASGEASSSQYAPGLSDFTGLVYDGESGTRTVSVSTVNLDSAPKYVAGVGTFFQIVSSDAGGALTGTISDESVAQWVTVQTQDGSSVPVIHAVFPGTALIRGEGFTLRLTVMGFVLPLKGAGIPRDLQRIESGAFAGAQLTELRLPESVSYIAEDALEGSAIRTIYAPEGSYAWNWAVGHGYTPLGQDVGGQIGGGGEEPESGVYDIANLAVVENDVTVRVTTDESCLLWLDVLDDAGEQVLYSRSMEVEDGLSSREISVSLLGLYTLPNYFRLSAILRDQQGKDLCQPLVTLKYTRAYARFEAQTPESFPNNIVVNLGERGFLVLADGAVDTGSPAIQTGENTYRVTTQTELQPGDVILAVDGDGVQYPILVLEATRDDGGETTVIRDESATISDVFRSIHLKGSQNTVGAGGKASDPLEVLKISGSLKLSDKSSGGAIKGTLQGMFSGTLAVEVEGYYDPVLFGEDEYDFLLGISGKVNMSFTGSGTFNTSNLKDAFGKPKHPEITLYESPKTLIGMPAVGFSFISLTVPLEASFTGSVKANYGYTYRFGYEISNTGNRPINELEPISDPMFEVDAKLMAKAGLKIAFKVETLGGMLTGELSGEAGPKLEATAEKVIELIDEAPTSVHACRWCVAVSISLYLDIKANISYQVTRFINGELVEVSLFPGAKKDMIDLYYSIVNDTDSPFGGKSHLGIGTCPNIKYRITVNTLSKHGEELSGIPVAVSENGGDDLANGSSPLVTWLYRGSYRGSAAFESGVFDKDFEVTNKAKEVNIAEKETEITGVVTNIVTESPVVGATLSVTLPNGKRQVAVSNEKGAYRLILPAGIHTVIVEADSYEDWTEEDVAVLPGPNALDFALNPIYTVKFEANGGNCDMTFARAPYGKALGTLPVATQEKAQFLGWNTMKDGSGQTFTAQTEVTGNITLYARWKYECIELSNFLGETNETAKARLGDIVVCDNGHSLENPWGYMIYWQQGVITEIGLLEQRQSAPLLSLLGIQPDTNRSVLQGIQSNYIGHSAANGADVFYYSFEEVGPNHLPAQLEVHVSTGTNPYYPAAGTIVEIWLTAQ